MVQKLKDFVLPIAILLGLLFHSFFGKLGSLVPWLVFFMLYFTLCSIDIKKIRISMLHIWVLIFQILISICVYYIIKPFDETIAQGVLVIMVSPTATSAPVIAAMLGANINTMVSSILLSNIAVTLVSPLYFSWAGPQSDIPFLYSSWLVFKKVAPLIIIPLVMAIVTQRYLPNVSDTFKKHKNISFYLWSASLTIVVGRTIDFIFQMGNSALKLLIYMAITSAVICFIQFAFGRIIGKRYGDSVAGGQSSGQKNTVLAIWMAQTYMSPLSSVVPALYVLWQNIYNSWQIWRKRKK
ncbi:MAG: hypothetical protein KA807_07125 [Prolixibacteraceae bacterium]|nr:hypothetical protein [Prolixibacteraceae bacterium]